MAAHSTLDPYRPIRSIIEEHSIDLDVAEFHAIVNEVFHAAEATVYDEVHADMWESLPAQFDLLARDVLESTEPRDHGFSVLDVGCGTGLSAELLMTSSLGSAIDLVTLLDPSPEMLIRAERRSRQWNVSTRTRRGFLHDLPPEESFDLVTACSVLHHIPDLASFGRQIGRITRPGGFFLHLHDPNGSAIDGDVLSKRELALAEARAPSPIGRLTPRHIRGKILSLFPSLKRREYLDGVNEELIRRGVVRSPLSPDEIWRITDLRVYDERGIHTSDLVPFLPDFSLVHERSYGFFGRMASLLPEGFRAEEERLALEGDMDGAHLAGIWRRSAGPS